MKKIIESVEAGLMTKSEIISINLHSFIKKNYIAPFKVTTQKHSQLHFRQKGRFSNDLEMYRYII